MSQEDDEPSEENSTRRSKAADKLRSVASASASSQSGLVGAATAGARALASQIFTFYIRVPVKLFRPTRVDYLALPRAINPNYREKPWNLFTHSGPALLAHAVKTQGWQFIPNHVLPPLIANAAIGAVLYSTYLTSLTLLQSPETVYIQPLQAFYSGIAAGSAQSLAAAPVDAIVTRFSVSDMLESNHKTMWGYGLQKLREIGPQGVLAGYSLSIIKESLGFGLFFATFETIRGPVFRAYRSAVYGTEQPNRRALFPSFVLLAGAASTFTLQTVHYPLGRIQKLHLMRLEAMDIVAKAQHKRETLFLYLKAYKKTFNQVQKLVIKDTGGKWFQWLYQGFFRNTIVSMPSTSIGLVVFEIMRTRFSDENSPLELSLPALTLL